MIDRMIRITFKIALLFLVVLLCCLDSFIIADELPTAPADYSKLVLADKPVGYWRFEEDGKSGVANSAASAGADLNGDMVGKLLFQADGPRPNAFPLFSDKNSAVEFTGQSAFARIKDAGENSPLDFDSGDSITMEAWVNPSSSRRGGFAYILGKGRTNNPGIAKDNHNYALRLSIDGNSAGITFLFRSRGDKSNWHRWTSGNEMAVGDGWHHVAVTYTFGEKDSLRGYIDGQRVTGKWDMGGATDRAPVVDDDELWIGSSVGGSVASTFVGMLDEVALYRTALSEERIHARYKYVAPPPVVSPEKVPGDSVLVDIFEGIPDKKSWQFRPPRYVESFHTNTFGFVAVPNKYSPRGVKVDRTNPFMIRAVSFVTIPKGSWRLLIRSRNASRLYVDEKLVAETKFFAVNGNAHGTVWELDASLAPNIRPLRRGDTQAVAVFEGDDKPHLIRFEMIVGGQNHRPELGETSVSIGAPDGDFTLLSPVGEIAPLTDAGWLAFADRQRTQLAAMNAERRRLASVETTKYWERRHNLARKEILARQRLTVPKSSDGHPEINAIDRFINKRLADAGEQSTPLIGDLAYLRRVTLDTIGTIPTPVQIEAFLADDADKRRANVIDRLLASDGWADNWVGYWQDVLAENPNIVNPTLNNTGPFRWWIYESFLDNKPFDRFATELIMMEGSAYFGGPGGFEMATQNDAPMAAKAHIVAQSLLAIQMKCARCHDAPYHDLDQRDLFSLAAMLKRGPQEVPKTSTIPGGEAAVKSLIVEVTLKPGEKIAPEWTFGELNKTEALAGITDNTEDMREKLAALITSPQNRRFAKVIVNRLWRRYIGFGLVEPVDDWEHVEPSHPQLLDFLADELVSNGYDLKHIARLILNSHVYQRAAKSRDDVVKQDEDYLFAAPLQRRMRAEQIVDSLFLAAGKPFDAGPMSVDIDGARRYDKSLHLGEPSRSWHFASLTPKPQNPKELR